MSKRPTIKMLSDGHFEVILQEEEQIDFSLEVELNATMGAPNPDVRLTNVRWADGEWRVK